MSPPRRCAPRAGPRTPAGTLDAVPEMLRDRWFERRPGGALGVKEAARSLVELQRHNLVTEPAPFAAGEVDLVVCRNVTIYFNRATTGALVGTFHDVLAEGGYLLLGHSETLWQVSDAFSLVSVGDAFVYRRSHDARRGAVLPRHRRAVPARPAPARALPVPAAAANIQAGPVVLSPGARRAGRAADHGASGFLSTARSHLAAGDYGSAAAAAEDAVRADQLLGPAYVVLGRARACLGQDAAAVDPLRKAVYLDPAAGDAHFLLAGALVAARSARRRRGVLPGRSRLAAPCRRRRAGRPVRRPRARRAGRAVRAAGRDVGRSRPGQRAGRRGGGCGVSGWVTFLMDNREMAGPLDEVREVVRATGIEGAQRHPGAGHRPAGAAWHAGARRRPALRLGPVGAR